MTNRAYLKVQYGCQGKNCLFSKYSARTLREIYSEWCRHYINAPPIICPRGLFTPPTETDYLQLNWPSAPYCKRIKLEKSLQQNKPYGFWSWRKCWNGGGSLCKKKLHDFAAIKCFSCVWNILRNILKGLLLVVP